MVNTALVSHPTWVRGLKLADHACSLLDGVSHPTWVRGLKLNNGHQPEAAFSRTLRGCVD